MVNSLLGRIRTRSSLSHFALIQVEHFDKTSDGRLNLETSSMNLGVGYKYSSQG